jgi:hypothetical protein
MLTLALILLGIVWLIVIAVVVGACASAAHGDRSLAGRAEIARAGRRRASLRAVA